MKKIILSLAMVAMSAVAVNAQLLVGGSFGVNASSSTSTAKSQVDGKKSTSKDALSASMAGFTIAPTIGYAINNWEVGLSFGLGGEFTTSKTHPVVNGKPVADKLVKDSKVPAFVWNVNPYARYYFFQKEGWGIAVEGGFNVGGQKRNDPILYVVEGVRTKKDVDDYKEKLRSVKEAQKLAGTKTIDSNVNWSVGFQPVITYTVKDHWVLVSKLGFLGLGLYGNVMKAGAKDTKTGNKNITTISTTSFNLNLLQQNGADLISFGCVYKF